ncbi:MAG: caspase family protein [Candidatus Celaenobacter antarcticus]|nr:caspase family protein [Candidatus Celaenobacter antarcticus]MDP8313895.1 caspase family protein [Candidatus Celaenobacter antarcticus]
MNKSISIILIIILLFIGLNLSFADISNAINNTPDTIQLPRIPIYIENHKLSKELDNYKQVDKKVNSFFQIEINNSKTLYKNVISDKSAIISGAGYGALIGDIFTAINTASKPDDLGGNLCILLVANIICGGIGALIGYASAPRDKVPHQNIFLIKILNGNKLIKQKEVTINYDQDISSLHLKELIDDTEFFTRWDSLYNLQNKYNKPINFLKIDNNYKNKLSLLCQNKGEFETTLQYNERKRKEKVIIEEIEAEYNQELSLVKDRYNIEKINLYRDIINKLKKFQFEKEYDFTVSPYNADQQSYKFLLIRENLKKNITVPFIKAKSFKENINDYKIQKVFKPTLNGTWETVSDDYVLIDTKTDGIIPWEGTMLTYAEKPVDIPPLLTASVMLIEPSGEGYLDAEETAIIKVTLSNTGKGPAKMTRVSLIQKEGPTLYYDVSNTIEDIQPNQSITSEFSITVPENIKNGVVEFEVSFLEEQGFEPATVSFKAQTREMLKPQLYLVDFGVDDSDGNGRLSKGETADITLRLQNIGQGTAKLISVEIIDDPIDNLFVISDNHFEIGNLESSMSKDIIFTISSNKRVNDEVDIDINISEKRPQFSLSKSLALEFEKAQKKLEPVVFAASDQEKGIAFSEGFSIDIEKNVPISKRKSNALAVIFGIEDYKNVSNVTFAHRDARFIKEYFNKTLGIEENNIYYKVNEDVGKAEFDKVFSKGGWLDKRVKDGKTEIYFYYAGHGSPDIKQNKAYLIPYDGDPNYASQTGYEIEKIYSNLANLKAKNVTVFLDACFSGANRESEMLLADARPITIEVDSPIAYGITVFSAASSKEISSAWPDMKHGLFSYFVMKGLQGNADENSDGDLTIKELGDYIQSNVSMQAGYLDREQTPSVISDDYYRVLINF